MLAFEEIYGSTTELQEIRINLKDRSHYRYKELREMCVILAVLKKLKNQEQTQLPALPTKVRRFGFNLF